MMKPNAMLAETADREHHGVLEGDDPGSILDQPDVLPHPDECVASGKRRLAVKG